MKAEEHRFLSGPRVYAGAVAANETCASHHCGAATGGADFAGASCCNVRFKLACAPHAFLTPRGSGSSLQRRGAGACFFKFRCRSPLNPRLLPLEGAGTRRAWL